MDLQETTLWGNPLQAYLIALAIFAGSLILSRVARRLLCGALPALTRHTATDLDDLLVERCAAPVAWLIPLGGLTLALGYLVLPPTVDLWINKILLALTIGLIFWLITRVLRVVVTGATRVYLRGVARRHPEEHDQVKETAERTAKQVSEILTMVLALMALLTILSNLGVDLMAIWASLGVGGIALALAVQEPLRNIVGRVYIYSTGIFDEGHFIFFDGWAGTVRRIGLFRTHLELFQDMTDVSIPNGNFVKGVVQNYHGRRKFMFKWDLDLPYEIPAEEMQEMVAALRELIHDLPEVNQESCWVYLERLDRYSKVIRVWFQANLESWAASLSYGNQTLHRIQLLFEERGVPFAFPTQTLELKGGPVAVALPQTPEGEAPGEGGAA